MSATRLSRPADVPVDVGRDEAREAAERELSDPIYHADDPSLVERVLDWLADRLGALLDGLSGVAPGGIAGVLVLLVLAVVAVVAIRLRAGKLVRTRRVRDTVLGERVLTAAEHRTASEYALARGDHSTAVTERFRAIVRELEQRAMLEVRGGQTADEIAVAAGAVLPDHAVGMRDGARVFDDVYYGGRRAMAEQYDALAALDSEIRSARPVLAGSTR